MRPFITASRTPQAALRVAVLKAAGKALRKSVLTVVLTVVLSAGTAASAQTPGGDTLAVRFEGKSGQVEVGGVFAGVEFHDSRPVPARISFYYPVANSIDLSTDYWKRGESRPQTIVVQVDGRTDTLGAKPWVYEWTPYGVVFENRETGYDATIEYRFAEDLPVVVMRLTIRNRTDRSTSMRVDTRLATTLHTSHTYAIREPSRTSWVDDSTAFLAHYDTVDTDSVALFVVNAGVPPAGPSGPASSAASFTYERQVEPGESIVVTQLIGTTRRAESASVRRTAVEDWSSRVSAYEDGIRSYVRDVGRFELRDPELLETNRLARALLRADRHYLDGMVVPMPSPAEYNFFFTHDLLLTDLGAVFFDPDRVKSDLEYVQSLVRADSVLPHARYWKDSTYVVEPANADNWNHLWVEILAASYLKHSGDTATIEAMYPTLRKSILLMLGNERGGLMYAERPDWWDIGHVYGPRAYLTSLMIRALDAYAYVSIRLGRTDAELTEHAATAARMRRALVDELWDDDAGYLLNGLDSLSTDRHYYTGSLLAAAFDLLDSPRRDRLLDTARRELLDERVGVRNAMPADYHLLTDLYHFQEGEVGAPYLYMNGGIWPQGNAWYALGLVAAGRMNEARDVLERYLSVAGVTNSPNGQPAFYEYRNADPASPAYGAVDKPTFLWAGGWFLHVLYQLAGVRETPWNVSFSPAMPDGFADVAYDLAVEGTRALVSWSGEGPSFRKITIDGVSTPSAVLFAPASRIELERGFPESPYLASATGLVDGVRLDADSGTLSVNVHGVVGQRVELVIVSPVEMGSVLFDGVQNSMASVVSEETAGVTSVRVTWTLDGSASVVTIRR